MMKKLTNKKLVEFWMDQRKVNDIIVRADLIIVDVRQSMTNKDAADLLKQCGQTEGIKVGADGRHRYIIMPRF